MNDNNSLIRMNGIDMLERGQLFVLLGGPESGKTNTACLLAAACLGAKMPALQSTTTNRLALRSVIYYSTRYNAWNAEAIVRNIYPKQNGAFIPPTKRILSVYHQDKYPTFKPEYFVEPKKYFLRADVIRGLREALQAFRHDLLILDLGNELADDLGDRLTVRELKNMAVDYNIAICVVLTAVDVALDVGNPKIIRNYIAGDFGDAIYREAKNAIRVRPRKEKANNLFRVEELKGVVDPDRNYFEFIIPQDGVPTILSSEDDSNY